MEKMAVASRVEISEEDGGIYLLRFSDSGECVGDTWHLYVAEAKSQARFEYGIPEEGWTELP